MGRAKETRRVSRVRVIRTDDYEIRVIGEPRTPLSDFYYIIMRVSWPTTIASIVGIYFLANGIFASLYLAIGGISHARTQSISDAFFFSVQTMGTIGYGAMFPESTGANIVVTFESAFSLLFTALATGLVFAKFSRPNARLMFSDKASVATMDGVPTLAMRVGNQRRNRIVEAEVRIALTRTETTREGKTFYRTVDLKLTRPRMLSLARSWTILHPIDEDSPLFGETAESLVAKEAEILVSVVGIDDTWMQTVHASHRYLAKDIAFGHRHVDIISETADALIVDLRRFHELEPSE
jgi:inward rectifier potassium channel